MEIIVEIKCTDKIVSSLTKEEINKIVDETIEKITNNKEKLDGRNVIAAVNSHVVGKTKVHTFSVYLQNEPVVINVGTPEEVRVLHDAFAKNCELRIVKSPSIRAEQRKRQRP